jgi:hypothetical protein
MKISGVPLIGVVQHEDALPMGSCNWTAEQKIFHATCSCEPFLCWTPPILCSRTVAIVCCKFAKQVGCHLGPRVQIGATHLLNLSHYCSGENSVNTCSLQRPVHSIHMQGSWPWPVYTYMLVFI